MTTDAHPPCDTVEERLAEAFLARGTPAADDLAHAAGCARCGAAQAELAAVAAGLALGAAPAPSELLVQRTQRRARAELAALREREQEEALAAPGASALLLPEGFARECGRLLLGSVAVLPLVLLWNGFVLVSARQLLGGVVPEALLAVAGGAYVACGAAWLTFLYGSIPFVAHRRARRIPSEVKR